MDVVKTAVVLLSIPFFLLYASVLLMYMGYQHRWLNLRLIALLSGLVALGAITWIGSFSGLSISTAFFIALVVAITQAVSFLVGGLLLLNLWKKIEIPF